MTSLPTRLISSIKSVDLGSLSIKQLRSFQYQLKRTLSAIKREHKRRNNNNTIIKPKPKSMTMTTLSPLIPSIKDQAPTPALEILQHMLHNHDWYLRILHKENKDKEDKEKNIGEHQKMIIFIINL
jgi:hypothetical protein